MAHYLPICLKFPDNFWETLLWDKELSDVVIVLKDSNGKPIWDIKVHSIVMRRRSKVFYETLKKGDKIEIDGVSIAILQKFIRFLYLGDVYVENREDMIQLISLGSRYSVKSLREELENSLIRFLTLFNTCETLQTAIEYDLVKLKEAVLTLVARAAIIVFTSGDFQRLKQETLSLILANDELNVSKEFDVFQALVCWGKGNAFYEGTKLDEEALVQKIEPLLNYIRWDQISEEDKNSIPKEIRELIFAKLEHKTEKAESDEEKTEKTDVEPKDQPVESKPRKPSKEICLASYFAHILFREKTSSISWPGLSYNTSNLLMRFSVTMPTYIGGFLMHYNHATNCTMTAHLIMRDHNTQTDVKHNLTLRNCEHKLQNEYVGVSNYHGVCYEPDTPILMHPGEECNVFLTPTYHNTVAHIQFPYTTFKTGEGPEFRLHLDYVRAIRKIYFLSACGRCTMSSLE